MFRCCILVALIAVSFWSCAYRIGHEERSLPQGYSQIAVPLFKNLTFEPGIEVAFTDEMILEIERSGIARVVDKEDAEVVLRGIIDGLNVVREEDLSSPYTVVPAGKNRLFVSVSLELVRRSDEKIIWANAVKTERVFETARIMKPLLSSANSLYDLSAKRRTFKLMARDSSSQAFDRLTERF